MKKKSLKTQAENNNRYVLHIAQILRHLMVWCLPMWIPIVHSHHILLTCDDIIQYIIVQVDLFRSIREDLLESTNTQSNISDFIMTKNISSHNFSDIYDIWYTTNVIACKYCLLMLSCPVSQETVNLQEANGVLTKQYFTCNPSMTYNRSSSHK